MEIPNEVPYFIIATTGLHLLEASSTTRIGKLILRVTYRSEAIMSGIESSPIRRLGLHRVKIKRSEATPTPILQGTNPRPFSYVLSGTSAQGPRTQWRNVASCVSSDRRQRTSTACQSFSQSSQLEGLMHKGPFFFPPAGAFGR